MNEIEILEEDTITINRKSNKKLQIENIYLLCEQTKM